jgi:hypothetical protein
LFRLQPVVSIVTAHGRQQLSWERGERLSDLLRRYGVPWSAVSTYVVQHSREEPVLRPCLDLVLSDSDAAEILLYFNRNVNPFLFSLAQFKTIKGEEHHQEATEYFYQHLDNERSTADVYLKKLSPEECQSIIAERVAKTIEDTLPAASHLVVGVSGGGDSNALLYALSQLREYNTTVHPVIIKGIPDWDKGVPRARVLCESYGLDLTVLEEESVKGLLGIPLDSVGLIDRFEREFKGDDFEFLGTLLIRLALFHHAREIGTSFVCTGLNLEDLLCENLFRISTGLAPAGVPTRTIGDTTLVFPLWLCPKRILDGCFPKFSRENYDARYPCFSLGRNLYYSVVYSVQSQFPGFVEQWARGIAELSLKNPVTYTFDEELGFHVERPIPLPLRHRFLKMLSR